MIKNRFFCLAAVLTALLVAPLAAQQPYKTPPQEIIDILDAPPPPFVLVSPDGNWLLLAERSSMPSIADLSLPVLRLGGLRIAPDRNARQMLSFITGLTLKNLADGSSRRVELPEGFRMDFPRWSPDSRRLAFCRVTDSGLELWAADVSTGQASSLSPAALNTIFAGPVWTPDSRRVLAGLAVEERGEPPRKPAVPVGPNIQEAEGKFVKAATYQDLLKTSYDEELFEHFALAQLVEFDVSSGSSRKLGAPTLLTGFDPSPDGRFLLITRLKRPFSYSVPAYSFARAYEIWNQEGQAVFVLADLPPAEEVPINGVPTGPRSPQWQTGRPAALVWAEALDGGDPEKEADFRDRLMSAAAPFQGPPLEIAKTQERFFGITWLGTEGMALVNDYNWKKSRRRTSLVDTRRPSRPPKVLVDINIRDRYNDPGRPVTASTPTGHDYALLENNRMYLAGEGASPQGTRPFLDRIDIRTLEKKRIFRSAAGRYESFQGFLGNSRRLILISSESPTEPPNIVRLDLKSGRRRTLTDFRDPAPQLTGIKKQLIKYKRADGINLSGTLYLPPGAEKGAKLPAVVWAYPLEYTDPAVAGQVRASPHRFTYFRGASHLFFLLQGYAVFDGAEMPIVGDPKTVNDTFVEQLAADARAAIDALDGLGVVDTSRVGVGGHSYGAFMTANLLAHTDVFAAGIARSGAYNRTLTPFGFQSERRTLWEARESYINMSPFMHAHKINEPILLIHGEADNNSGTFPIQSERLFAALKGFGATARLVMLPLESHGYAARESVLHVVTEMLEWFDRHVKNRK
ncbi:MAG: S9 family peptidase [Candidatus Aminicenantes bacterium]|nr:S9 family peptidase [Candidatus Aminicenantes bacterium]